MDIEETKQNTTVVDIKDPEEFLMNITASCLLKEMRFYDSKEERVPLLLQSLVKVSQTNPEFILQLALYIRQEMYIRSTTNFLLAFATLCKETKPFVSKYFRKACQIPKDLIDVCQYAQVLRYSKNNNFQSFDIKSLNNVDIRKNIKFPQVLKEAIAEKLLDFKEFQIGKACSDSNRKKIIQKYKWFFNPNIYRATKQIKKEKRLAKEGKEIKSTEQGNAGGRGGTGGRGGSKKKFRMKEAKEVIAQSVFDLQFLSMKDIITRAHLKEPQYLIRKILGVKYPSSQSEFDLVFKSDISKDPSLQFDGRFIGNRMKVDIPVTWETELSAKGNQPEIWTELVTSKKIGYLALLRNLRNILKVNIQPQIHDMILQSLTNEKTVANSKIFPLQFYSAMSVIEEFKLPENFHLTQEQLDTLKSQYKAALNTALNLSVDKNLEEMPGKTVLFVDVSASLRIPISGGKNYGSIRKSVELALILGLMIKTKSPDCEFIIFSSPAENTDGYIKVENLSGNFTEEIERLQKEIAKLGGGTVFPLKALREYINKGVKIDSFVIISDMMIGSAAKNKQIKALEVVFCIDTTGSMGPYIQTAKDAIIEVTEKLDMITESNQLSGKFGVVAYRDHPPQESSYVTEIFGLNTPGSCCEFIKNLTAAGGGDLPEAVFDGLFESLKLNWTPGDDTKRIIIHVADAPPHGTKYSTQSGFPQGCPCNINETQIATLLKEKEVDYKFLKIGNETDTMEKIFESVFPTFEMQKIDGDMPMNILAEEMVLNQIGSEEISRILNEYREKVKSDVKIFSIDIGGYNKNFDFGKEMNENNLVKIVGTSDSILKFISLRGKVSQVEAVKAFASGFINK